MTRPLWAENLKSETAVRHGFFLRHDDAQTVACALGVAPERLLFCRQIHSPDVMSVSEPWRPTERPSADAMVTKGRGMALGILTADCVPVLLADAAAGVIGAAHAGWRGAIGGVLDNVLQAMEAVGAARAKIAAALGPCIWQKSYEVGPDFPAPFLAEDPANEKLFRLAARPGYYLFDLPGYVMGKLQALGVVDIEPSPADTCADESRFFSYRRDCLRGVPCPGRLISAIVLT